jgi:uncharacterized protein
MIGTFVAIEDLLSAAPARPLAAAAKVPWFHLVPGPTPLVLVVESSQIYQIDREHFDRLEAGDLASLQALRLASGASTVPGTMGVPTEPTSLSLNLAQACNLSCSYCYADLGRFGGGARLMPLEVALAAIDRLLEHAAGRRVTVGYIGGEPFLNREVLHRSVAYARERGRALGIPVTFSVTTNATRLTPTDIDLLRQNRFSVSVSLDGLGEQNERHRNSRFGSSSLLALDRIRPLLDDPGAARIVARATVARDDLRVAERIADLSGVGFQEVGVSPLRSSADSSLQLRGDDWAAFLTEMIRAAEADWGRVRRGGNWRFSNVAIALKELQRGSCRPLPCGAAAGYVSVGAGGDYFTCHRTIDDPRFRIGDLAHGPDAAARSRFLTDRHVDRQEPCRSCWARYLCGGGCHAEVVAAGRTGCDYIRGWLDYCIGLHDRVLSERPDLLAPGV